VRSERSDRRLPQDRAGRYGDRPFHLTIDAGYSFCDQTPAVVRDLWVLSTFPCSNRVLRMDRQHVARTVGCAPE
jgi:hypothetical protein